MVIIIVHTIESLLCAWCYANCFVTKSNFILTTSLWDILLLLSSSFYKWESECFRQQNKAHEQIRIQDQNGVTQE